MKRTKVSPESVDVALVSAAVGEKPPAWEGNCYAVACKVAPLVGGRPAYGHWLGLATGAYWKDQAGRLFYRHGWVVLPDGRILDPTRWSFEGVAPYIWLDANDGNYDEGGQVLRHAFRLPAPPDEVEKFRVLKVSSSCIDWLCGLLGRTQVRPEFTPQQLGWLASGPLANLGELAYEFFAALAKMKLKGLIPIDHWRMVMGVEK
jgi:hypothetical protein